jgi:hypothetical protein
MRRLIAFGRFWYDFLVGDDWRIAVVVVPAVALTAALAPTVAAAWLVLPLSVSTVLVVSIVRATRR